MGEPQRQATGRAAQRLRTHERLFEASVAEFKRTGVAAADVREIVASAGVAQGTFYFHFPAKSDVLLELERREDVRIAADLRKALDRPHTLVDALTEVTDLILGMERRLGGRLVRELLGHHFSPSRPDVDTWTNYQVIVQVVEEIERAQERGEADPNLDAATSATLFMLGVYGVLASTPGPRQARRALLDALISRTVRSLETR
jgi:AcrR family transcriptional regulator